MASLSPNYLALSAFPTSNFTILASVHVRTSSILHCLKAFAFAFPFCLGCFFLKYLCGWFFLVIYLSTHSFLLEGFHFYLCSCSLFRLDHAILFPHLLVSHLLLAKIILFIFYLSITDWSILGI